MAHKAAAVMTERLNGDLCKQLAENVESLTHTGQKTLDESKLKKIKQICKLSNDYVKHTYHLLLCQLEKQHSEIRYSAFQICDVLFRRSHCFRELLVSELQCILELTAETNPDKPLPLPKSVAKDLKILALKTMQQWNKEFGEGYKKLQLGYNFLRNCKKVDFNALEAESNAERLRQQEIEHRKTILNNKKLKAIDQEYADMKTDICNTITALNNCISLILPEPENFFISEEKETEASTSLASLENSVKIYDFKGSGTDKSTLQENSCRDDGACTDEEESSNTDIRAHGLISGSYKIEVQLKPDIVVNETPENAAIFENAKGFCQLLTNRYLPSVKNWIKVITKCSGSSAQLKETIALKQRMEALLDKWSQIKTNLKLQNDTDDTDSDFEEVEEKEGYEETVMNSAANELNFPLEDNAKNVVPTYKSKGVEWNISLQENDEEDPTTAMSTLVTLTKTTENTVLINKFGTNTEKSGGRSADEAHPSTSKDILQPSTSLGDVVPSTSGENATYKSRKERLLEVAPKLPFDVDLYHWEDENIAAPTMFCVKPDGARFWSATSTDELEEIPVPEGAASLRTRVIEFTGKYEPVKWACRAPLPSGKLCPRRDRYKCPFHGAIVPRDEKGQRVDSPSNVNSEVNSDCSDGNIPDWQDPQLLEDIKEATGIDLKMPEKRRKQSKRKETKNKFPGLTDIKAKRKSSFERLSKKIFKKSSVKKVATALDQLDHKRFRDKYGDQFNYMYDTA